MPRTETNLSTADFVADHYSTVRGPGGIIDWANVPATYIPAGGTKKVVPGGTIMIRQTDGSLLPRVDRAALDEMTANALLVATAIEDSQVAAKSGYGVFYGGSFFTELLPEAAAGTFAAMIAELQASGPFVFHAYNDDTTAA